METEDIVEVLKNNFFNHLIFQNFVRIHTKSNFRTITQLIQIIIGSERSFVRNFPTGTENNKISPKIFNYLRGFVYTQCFLIYHEFGNYFMRLFEHIPVFPTSLTRQEHLYQTSLLTDSMSRNWTNLFQARNFVERLSSSTFPLSKISS